MPIINLRTFVKVFCFAILFFNISSIYAQNYILKAKVVSKDHKPIEFVDVDLFKNDTLLVKTAYSDSLGIFSFKVEKGKYRLVLQEDGVNYFHKDLEMSQDTDLGEIQVDKGHTIKGITITAKKKLVERKIDRLIFNVENSIASNGMDGIKLLSNTPMLKVDENAGISIVGKNQVSVMVNDRMVNLSGEELMNYLKSLRSDNISKIEVITTPPSKYEAQGNSGIINIILKKNLNMGWSGSLSTSYKRRSEDGFSNNVNLNYQNKKINSSLKLHQYDNKKRSNEISSIEATHSLYSNDQRLDMNNGFGINFSSEIQLNDKSIAGIVYDFADSNNNMDIRNLSEYKTFSNRDSLLSTYAEHRQNAQIHVVNLYYDYKIDSLDKKLSLSVNYFSNNPKNQINFTTNNLAFNRNESFTSYNYTNYNVWSAQSDFTLPLKFAAIETGTKFSSFGNRSDLKYYRIDEYPIILPDGTNLFNYNEENYAIYVSAEKIFSDRLTAKGGLRYEYSVINTESPITATHNNYNYGQFFPTVYVSYKHNLNNMFTLSYSRRINRPFFSALNPNRWYTNPYNFSKGNPLLRPSYNNNFELGYSFKSKINLSMYYQNVTNSFSQLVTFNDVIKTIDYANMYNEKNVGVNASYYDTFFKIWEVNLEATVYYTKSKNIIPQIIGQKSFNFDYSINNTVSIDSKKNIQMFMSYSQMLPGTSGNYKSNGYTMLDIGGKLSLMNKKMQINIYFEDVFKKGIFEGQSIYSNFIFRNRNYYDIRSFNISFNYSFGNSKVKGSNKTVNFDEKDRAK